MLSEDVLFSHVHVIFRIPVFLVSCLKHCVIFAPDTSCREQNVRRSPLYIPYVKQHCQKCILILHAFQPKM